MTPTWTHESSGCYRLDAVWTVRLCEDLFWRAFRGDEPCLAKSCWRGDMQREAEVLRLGDGDYK